MSQYWQTVLDRANSLVDVHAVALDSVEWDLLDLTAVGTHWTRGDFRGGGLFVY